MSNGDLADVGAVDPARGADGGHADADGGIKSSVGRHLVGAGVIALLGVAVLVGVTSRSSFDRERAHASAQLAAAAQTTADSFGQDSVRELMTSLAVDPALASGDPARCSAGLSSLSGTTGAAHIHVLRPDGSEVCSLRASDLDPSPITPGTWFQQAMGTGELVVTDAAMDPLSGQPAFVAAVALTAGNGSGAVLAAVIYTGVPVLQVPSGLPRQLFLVMTDKARTMVVSRSENAPYQLGQRVAGTPLATPVSRGGSNRDDGNGRSLMLRETAAATYGWPVVAAVPAKAALGPARSQLWRSVGLGGLFAALIVVVGLVLHHRLVRPVRRLHLAIEASRSGTADSRAPVAGPVELARVAAAYNALIGEREALEHDLRHRATHDPLTGLPNRRALSTRLAGVLEDSLAPPMVAVLFIDLDRFKLVNDSHGHAVGDRLLVALGARLAESLPNCVVARFGGDEFVILATDVPGELEARLLAERVGDVLRQPFRVDGQEMWLSGSVGIALPNEGEDAEDLIRNADTAMYRAKASGSDRVALFDSEMRAWSVGLLSTERDLHRALDVGQFELHYQPVISVDGGRILGVEALLRWRHPERGLVLPADFVPVAEQTRLIVPIGAWVLDEVCRQVVAWREAGLHIPVAVNLAAQQLAHADLAETIAGMLRARSARPDEVSVEITESAVLADVEMSRATLSALREQGIRVAVDDFGTGYSSLSYLQRLPVDTVKVDRSFVEPIGRDPRTAAIVSSLIGLSHAIGLSVIAEGVEDEVQLHTLAAMECDCAQGFHLGRPVPADELARQVQSAGTAPEHP